MRVWRDQREEEQVKGDQWEMDGDEVRSKRIGGIQKVLKE